MLVTPATKQPPSLQIAGVRMFGLAKIMYLSLRAKNLILRNQPERSLRTGEAGTGTPFYLGKVEKSANSGGSTLFMSIHSNGQPALGHSAPRRYCCSKGPCQSRTQREGPEAHFFRACFLRGLQATAMTVGHPSRCKS